MEQRNKNLGGWKLGKESKYETTMVEEEMYSCTFYSLEEMLRERYLLSCVKEWDKENEEEYKEICEKIVEEYDEVKPKDVPQILRDRNIKFKDKLLKNGLRLEEDSYVERGKKSLGKILKALLGSYEDKIKKKNKYRLTRENVLFLNYLLDMYENKEIKLKITNDKNTKKIIRVDIIGANETFWWQAQRGMKGFVRNRYMKLTRYDVRKRLNELGYPYIELQGEIRELRELLEEIESISKEGNENTKFFRSTSEMILKFNNNLGREIMKVEEFKKKTLKELLNIEGI